MREENDDVIKLVSGDVIVHNFRSHNIMVVNKVLFDSCYCDMHSLFLFLSLSLSPFSLQIHRYYRLSVTPLTVLWRKG